MARTNFDTWIPEETGGQVITKMAQLSVIEDLARPEPMASSTKSVPRDGGMSFSGAISKGSAYNEDAATEDEVLLTARKFGKVVRIADEDMKDTDGLVNILRTKRLDWARSHAVGFDHACLGTSAASNGTTVPFLSLYQALNTTNAAVGYTADANLITSATATAITYANLSNLFALVEGGGFWSDQDMVVIAHPHFRGAMRGILDSTNRPVFVDAPSGSGTPPTLFDVPIRWSLGARAHATATDAPTGAPLLFVGNRNYLIKGDRSGPEYMLATADSGAAFLTDEALLKMRIRRAFAVANENAWAVLEDVI